MVIKITASKSIALNKLVNAKAVTSIKINKTQSLNAQIVNQTIFLKYLSQLSWAAKSVLKDVLHAMKGKK